MKTNERILINSMLSTKSELFEGIVLDAFESMEEVDVANTYRKRVALGGGVTETIKSHVDTRIHLPELIDKIIDSDADKIKKKKALLKLSHSLMDSSAVHGYIVGKYAVNNETLDGLVLSLKNAKEEAKKYNPEEYAELERLKNIRKEEGLSHAEKECGVVKGDSAFAKFKKGLGL